MLTTLDRIKSYARFENSRDVPRILSIIEQVSNAVSLFCDRTFERQTYSRWMYSEGVHLLLPQWPIREVQMIGYGCETVAMLRYTSYNTARYVSVGVCEQASKLAVTVFNQGNPSARYISMDGKTVETVANEVLALDPANWLINVYPRAQYIPAYCLWQDLSMDAIIGAYLKAPVRLVPLSAMAPRSERAIEHDCPEGWRMFIRWTAGYTCPTEESPDTDLPTGLIDIVNRCVVEAVQASMDVQFQRKAVVFDWLKAHAAELSPYRLIS